MRICRSASQLEDQFPIAQGEAKAAFSDSSLYIEKFVSGARHIEIQVIGDRQGKVTAFGERECSVQRRYQKLIEETPSPFIDWKTRRRMIKEVEDAASEVGYQSLGTFEFLVDDDHKFYFMEANARVQVEHPDHGDGLRHQPHQGPDPDRRRGEVRPALRPRDAGPRHRMPRSTPRTR